MTNTTNITNANWGFYTLSWVYLNSSSFNSFENIKTLSEMEIRYSISMAFHEWSIISNLNFIEEYNNNKSDIKIAFMRKQHGCIKPFDGKGGILGHAFFPIDPVKGVLHLDLDEEWTKDKLTSVLIHEIGHVLGLSHDKNINSVMFYRYVQNNKPTKEDKKEIQKKYKKRLYYPVNALTLYDSNASELKIKISFDAFKNLLKVE